MKDVLNKIGFYTLEDKRAKNCNINSPLWRCELILTDRCNFKCPYCRGMKEEDKGDLTWEEAKNVIDIWVKNGLKNIRFSGGEPTLWRNLSDLVLYTKSMGVERIAISTNGSADLSYYMKLYNYGVNDISISLDSCCSATFEKMSNSSSHFWKKLKDNISNLSSLTYVTIGVVLNDENINEVNDIVKLSYSLGVSDIRLISAAQDNKILNNLDIPNNILDKCKILKYRYNNVKNNRSVRGIQKTDTNKCPLVIDDMAVMKGYHYPCIIYLREQGNPIGKLDNNVREERYNWYKNHDCFKDDICRNNCLDVCIDYNNRFFEINKFEKKKKFIFW